MATTAVVAEILIIGLEAAAWLALLLLTVFGTGWIEAGALSDFAALTTLAVLACAYVLGILVERSASSLFTYLRSTRAGWWLNRSFGRSSLRRLLPASFATMRMEALRLGGPVAAFIEYQRSTLRVIRGTALNLAIGAPVVFAFLWRTAEKGQAAAAAGFLLAALAASILAAERIRTAYVERLLDAYALLVSEEEKTRPKPGDIVAAITYRFIEDESRLLLVQTRRRRWTFPKGKVESGESGSEAALRVGREKAGVDCTIEEGSFTRYCYPSGDGEREVVAYLLRADPAAEGEPCDAARAPTWVSDEQARERLRRRWERRYRCELVRVLKETRALIPATPRKPS